ncbi:MAG: hypothetical protein GYA35_10090 [Thermoanaerobaculaceae bacterium]|nr:hypothetical protein [Thermoanaerobaculaceae bacterium]
MKFLKVFLFVFLAISFSFLISAEFYCKKFDVAMDQWIKIDDGPKPVVVQDLKFEFPSYIGPKKLNIKGISQAVVNFKNYGETPLKVKIAIALFDEYDNLVGCGTASSKFVVTRAGKEEKVVVPFNYVKSRLEKAKYFIITVETE